STLTATAGIGLPLPEPEPEPEPLPLPLPLPFPGSLGISPTHAIRDIPRKAARMGVRMLRKTLQPLYHPQISETPCERPSIPGGSAPRWCLHPLGIALTWPRD